MDNLKRKRKYTLTGNVSGKKRTYKLPTDPIKLKKLQEARKELELSYKRINI